MNEFSVVFFVLLWEKPSLNTWGAGPLLIKAVVSLGSKSYACRATACYYDNAHGPASLHSICSSLFNFVTSMQFCSSSKLIVQASQIWWSILWLPWLRDLDVTLKKSDSQATAEPWLTYISRPPVRYYLMSFCPSSLQHKSPTLFLVNLPPPFETLRAAQTKTIPSFG